MGELLLINEEVDTLFKILGLAGIDTMMEWRQVWTADQRVQQELMTTMVANTATVMGELQNTRAQLEAMMLLQFETEQRSERHSDNAMQLMQSMLSTVVKGSKATVEKLPPWFLPSSELEFEPEAFASVHRGVWGSGTHVVVKRFLVDDSTEVDVSVKLQIEAEMNLWHQFNYPNIIKMFGASHVSSPPFIVCEDATNGDLCSFLARSEINKGHKWRMLYQAGLGLDYMHKKRVVHGDLKLNNILVGADGQAKLSDFGLSSGSGLAAASEAAIAGGLRWRAPECLTHAPTFASDVYSFAMCMIEAEIGNPPFAFLDDDGVRENLRDGTIPDKPDTMSSDEWDLVVSMTNVDPAKRISLLSVLEKLKRFAKQEATANPDGAPIQTFAATQSLTSAEVVQSSVVGASNRIAELLDKIAVARDDDIEQSLLKLVRECLNDDHRTLLYEADGIQILSNVVRTGRISLVQLYALQCLKWPTICDSKLSVSKFNALRNCVEAVPKSDVVSLLNALQKGTDYEKEQALIRCVCITSERNRWQTSRNETRVHTIEKWE
ncbi:hypothetical protein PI124_g8193 [Phytophthora idaei]|nr:hypothetical protein PI124_g8193 [Phytophthora idaei]